MHLDRKLTQLLTSHVPFYSVESVYPPERHQSKVKIFQLDMSYVKTVKDTGSGNTEPVPRALITEGETVIVGMPRGHVAAGKS